LTRLFISGKNTWAIGSTKKTLSSTPKLLTLGEKAYKLKHSKEFGWQVVKPYETNSHKESAFKYVRSRLDRSDEPLSNTHLVAFKNCVVDMRTGQTMPHSKQYLLTSMIPYDYEPGKECPETFRQFIAESFGEDMLPIIRAFTSCSSILQLPTDVSPISSVNRVVARVLWGDFGIVYGGKHLTAL
jgi:phage/plasmid-associated DNA primase